MFLYYNLNNLKRKKKEQFIEITSIEGVMKITQYVGIEGSALTAYA